ncbi:MAG TPA: gamma carbonic anhydrase family protein [Polyangium sp.]|nr:gamma carbonic anhydrase family protein [Polyangium sp.]
MALVLPYGDHSPRLGRGVFLAPNATLVGDVELGDEASVWFGAVLRGDIGPIRIGARTNVQDLACLHLTDGGSGAQLRLPERSPRAETGSKTTIGADVTIGHGAILHGCTVEDGCLIGMGSIVLDNAVIGAGSVIAAGALVPPRMVIPPRSMVKGSPAKVVREVTDEEAMLGLAGAMHYVLNAQRYRGICGD